MQYTCFEGFCLIFCHERQMYWKPNRCGYTSEISEAGAYALEEAVEICFNANKVKIEESLIPLETTYEFK